MANEKPILGILLGDSTGVGPELVAKVAISGFLTEQCRPIIIGDMRIFERGLKFAGGDVKHYAISDVSEADWEKGLPILDQKNQDPDELPIKQISLKAGAAVNDMLTLACEMCKEGKIKGFAFAPFNKSAMIEGGCKFESEHHLMAHIFGVTGPVSEINVLGHLMTVRTTSHIPIAKVSENLTTEKILRVTTLLNQTVANSGVAHPRLAVCALNPHCGENGRCGREELDVIAPAIEAAHKQGIDLQGPYSADILFIKAFNGDFDGVVTMYHDQGQIALKLKGFDQGITVAGGQPYPIVTCAHGTAYDITGTGKVMTSSFENAVKMTVKMAMHNRTK